MGKKVIADIFSSISHVYDTFLSSVTLGGIHRWQNTLLSMGSKKGFILDVGTGTGEVAKKSLKAGYDEAIGIDISVGMLKVAKSKCEKCTFIVADGESMPFKDEVFDTITLSLVYRHLTDRKAFLIEANRVLKRGGYLCILDIGKIPLTGLILFLMKTVLKPLGVLIFGKDNWSFFIHSIENSLNIAEVQEDFKIHNIRPEKVEKVMGGIILIISGVKE